MATNCGGRGTTRTSVHARWIEEALRAGKYVLAEKPLTTRHADTERLLTLARILGRALVENVMFVHHSQHATVAGLVRDGVIGELRSFHAAFTVPRRPAGDIRYRAELGGGALWDTGVYPVRAALHFLGDELMVAGASLAHVPWTEVDVGGAALVRTPDGVSAQLTFGLDHAYRSRYELCGSSGHIAVEHAFTPPAEHAPRIRVERLGEQDTITLSPDDQVRLAVTAFVRAATTAPRPTRCRSAQRHCWMKCERALSRWHTVAARGPTSASVHGTGPLDRQPTHRPKESEHDVHLGTPLADRAGPAGPRPRGRGATHPAGPVGRRTTSRVRDAGHRCLPLAARSPASPLLPGHAHPVREAAPVVHPSGHRKRRAHQRPVLHRRRSRCLGAGWAGSALAAADHHATGDGHPGLAGPGTRRRAAVPGAGEDGARQPESDAALPDHPGHPQQLHRGTQGREGQVPGVLHRAGARSRPRRRAPV